MEEDETRVVGIARQETRRQFPNWSMGGSRQGDVTLVLFRRNSSLWCLEKIGWTRRDGDVTYSCFTPPSFMILRSLCRPQRQLQAVFSSITASACKQRSPAASKTVLLPRCSHLPSSARRGLATQPTGFEGHRLPTLPHDETYSEHGVDGFLSPEGYDLAWTQYQSMMIEKLNTMTMGMPRCLLLYQNPDQGAPSIYLLTCSSKAPPTRQPNRCAWSKNTVAPPNKHRSSITPPWPATTTSSSAASPPPPNQSGSTTSPNRSSCHQCHSLAGKHAPTY